MILLVNGRPGQQRVKDEVKSVMRISPAAHNSLIVYITFVYFQMLSDN